MNEDALSEKDVNPNYKSSADEMALERAELKKEIDSILHLKAFYAVLLFILHLVTDSFCRTVLYS